MTFGKKSLSGFTLIEVLIVLTIVALMVGVGALFNVKSTLGKGRDAKRKMDLNKLVRIMEDYYNDNLLYPPVNSPPDGNIKDAPWGLPFSPYLTQLPKDPLSSKSDYYYLTNAARDYYVIYAKLENTADPDITAAGCQAGCGPGSAFNYMVKSSNYPNAL